MSKPQQSRIDERTADSCLSFSTEETRQAAMKAEPWALVIQPCGNPRITDFYVDSIIELCNEVDRLQTLLAAAIAHAGGER